MVFDCPRADEELGADLGIRQAVAGKPGDLLLLRRELAACFDVASSNLLTRRYQLPAGTLGERLHADRHERVMGCTHLLARLEASTAAPQPLSKEQPGASELRAEPGPV
jgi:hypothetical protein